MTEPTPALRIVESDAVPANTAIAGDFSEFERAGREDGPPNPPDDLSAVTAERDKLVEIIGRLVSLPPAIVAEAYGVTYTGEAGHD